MNNTTPTHSQNSSSRGFRGAQQGASSHGAAKRRPGGFRPHRRSTNMKDISKNWKPAPTFDGKPAVQTAPTGQRSASSVRPGAPRPHQPMARVMPARSGSSNKLRISVLGGVEEVGRNMTMLEYGKDIILIDCGLEFPEEDMPGIDYIIPNIEYLKGRERDVRGIIITHAHYDHIGAIPHVSQALHNPPIFSARLTLGIIAKRQDDFPGYPKLDLREVDIDGQIKLGDFIVEFIRINHSVPDSLAIVVRTPEGIILHTGDFKFDLTPIGDQVTDFAKLSRIGNEGVLALMADSTNASKPGQQLSEKYIGKTIQGIMDQADGRIIVGTFASNLNRVQQLIWSAEELQRFVVLEGFSMKTNVEIAKALGYLTFNSKTIISAQDAVKLPPHKLIIICTGAQGEGGASLMRIATKEHRFFQIEKGDTVIFSSSVIPGNERSVQNLKDTLLRQGARVVHYQMMDVHAGGHAQQEDLKLLIRLINPKYYIPVEGNHFLLHDNANAARELGYTDDNIMITANGQVMEFLGGQGVLTKEMLPSDAVMVDGLGVGDVSEVVLRDRQLLAEDGMFVVIVTINSRDGKVAGAPDIISRGFVYTKGNQLIEEARKKILDIVEPHLAQEKPNPVYLKNKLRDDLGQYLFEKIQRRPMILPVIVEI